MEYDTAEESVLKLALLESGVAATLVNLTDWLYTFGVLGLAATVLATSLAILRTSVFPRWVAWAGFVVATLQFFMVPLTGNPIILLVLWVLVVSVLLLRRPSTFVVVSPQQAGK